MKKVFGVGASILILVGLLVSITFAADVNIPCGFNRLADVCMQYEPTENGVRGKDFILTDKYGSWKVKIGYKEGSFVGLIVSGVDETEYPPIAIIFDIKTDCAYEINEDGEATPLTKEDACTLIGIFWKAYDSQDTKEL